MHYIGDALQIPAVHEGFIPAPGGHLPVGVRCPRCQKHEVVYNGNYFCFDERDCGWVLLEFSGPHFIVFETEITKEGVRRSRVPGNWRRPSAEHIFHRRDV